MCRWKQRYKKHNHVSETTGKTIIKNHQSGLSEIITSPTSQENGKNFRKTVFNF